MTPTFKRLLIASATAAVLASASWSAMARGGEGCDGPMGQGPRAEKMQQRMTEHRVKRQAELKAQLKLAPEQEAAWNQFTQATQPLALEGKRPNPADMAKLTTPERIDHMQALKTQRDAHMNRKAEATKAIYAALSAEQRVVFDAETLHKPWGQRGHHMGKGPGGTQQN